MADIERLISRYLDGELTAAEQEGLRKVLAESAEARALLHEMTAVRRAAKGIPSLHAPSQGMEQRLFQRLQAEGLHRTPEVPQATREHQRKPVPLLFRYGRGITVAAASLLLMLGGVAGYWIGSRDDASRTMAEATAARPSVTASQGSPRKGAADHGAVLEAPGITIDQTLAIPPPVAGLRSRVALRHRGAEASSALRERVAPAQSGTDSSQAISSLLAAATPDTSAVQEPVALASLRSSTIPAPDPVPVSSAAFPIPSGGAGERASAWAASFRGGMGAIGDREGTTVQELDLKLGMGVGRGHQVSVIVGLAPAITDTRNINTWHSLSAPALSQIPPNSDPTRSFGDPMETPVEFERSVRNEPWVGVGYNYSLPLLRRLSIDPGVRVGAGASTWRVGTELPVRYRLSETMSVECALSLSHVLPRRGNAERDVITDSPDHFLYEHLQERPAFTTYGAQLGVRIDLGVR